jgi:orotate phosphoribosyltransferase
MNQQNVLSVLENHHAIITNSHIVYTSGKHGSTYINKDAVYLDPVAVSSLCEAIAEHFADAGVQVVAGPAIGGVILSQWVAYHLRSRQLQAIAVYAEKTDAGTFVFRRGYDKIIGGKGILVVDDILTTGGSAKEVTIAARQCGGNVVGVAALCNRGSVTKEGVGNPPEFFTLANLVLEAWDEASCPLCANKMPINTNVGKGRDFLLRTQMRDGAEL